MTHPLVKQLRFARSEFMRGLEGVSEEDAAHRFLPMNCIAWMVGHLADQENRAWVKAAQGRSLYPQLNDLAGWGKPASTPSLAEMLAAWREITAAADEFHETLTSATLQTHIVYKGRTFDESIGTMLQRGIYHYWFHNGEAQAVRQLLGHRDLPEFVGDANAAPYLPEQP
jgi:hypothetical protein